MDSFTITLIFILISTLFAIFMRRKSRDKCLKAFEDDIVVIEKITGQTIPPGRLKVENTGLEISYIEKIKGEFGLLKTSYVLYKYEFPQIQAIIRYIDQQTPEELKRRQKEFEKVYHPKFRRRARRRIQNIFKTIKDSFAEVLTVFISHIQKAGDTGKVIKDQNKYVSQMKTDLIESVGSAYEPLMERYIGKMVVFELIRGDKKEKYSGILKDYTANFIELLDVEYKTKDDEKPAKADLILSQKLCVIRHLGEVEDNQSILDRIKNMVPRKEGKS